MKETFEQYLQRLKDRRTEDDYKYTDEDFKKYIYYIFDCYEKGMSVYKCLEFMYFAERDMDDQLFNRESKQECTITKIMQMDAKMAYDSLPKQETLEEAAERIRQESFTCCSLSKSINYVTVGEREKTAFYKGAKWHQEQHDFLPGFIKQFEEGGEYQELTNEDWSVSQFLKWLKSNKFKIVK
jgi:hypothetical protein